MTIRFPVFCLFACLLGFVLAQNLKPLNGFQRDFQLSFNDAETKTISLAKAMPAEK